VRLLVEALGVLSTPLAGSLGLDVGQALAAVVAVHVLDILEGNGRDPARGLPRLADLAVELVDLLERQALGLIDHGPDEEGADKTEATPNEEDFSAQIGISGSVVHHVRCSVSDRKIE
jgi:hypothetical protein